MAGYARGVVAGLIPASRWVKAACRRHLSDLDDAHERGLWWDQTAADHAVQFFSNLQHSKGRWDKQPFHLSGWQAFIVGSLIGWRRADGTRRYRIAFCDVPRKNGKTTLAAGIGLYLLVCDGEAGAEIYSAATRRDQAKLVFADAKALVGRCESLKARIERFVHSLQIEQTRSKFEPLGADSDGLDGLNPFVAICDEIHAWKSRDLWDVLITGMGARDQPLMLAITTAGDFSDNIYNELRTDAEQILEAVGQPDGIKDDAVFAYIACVDPEDDWLDESCWGKANPNLGVSLKASELREVITRAKRQPSSQNKVKRNRLGIRTAALNAWLRLDRWDRCDGRPIDWDSLAGSPCWGGLDLSSTTDLAAFSLLFPYVDDQGKTRFRLRVWVWCPGDGDDASAERLRRKLWPWSQSVPTPWIEFTEGDTIDIEAIETTILAAAEKYQIQAVAFDPWNAESTQQRMTAAGVRMVKHAQNCATYNEPARGFERAVLEGRICHEGNPLMRWMVGNCVIAINGAGLTMPSKKKSRDKIDGVVSSVMSFNAYLRADRDNGPSVYETRGFD